MHTLHFTVGFNSGRIRNYRRACNAVPLYVCRTHKNVTLYRIFINVYTKKITNKWHKQKKRTQHKRSARERLTCHAATHCFYSRAVTWLTLSLITEFCRRHVRPHVLVFHSWPPMRAGEQVSAGYRSPSVTTGHVIRCMRSGRVRIFNGNQWETLLLVTQERIGVGSSYLVARLIT